MRTKQNKLLGELMAGVFIVFWFLISYLLSYQSINALISPISNLMTVPQAFSICRAGPLVLVQTLPSLSNSISRV